MLNLYRNLRLEKQFERRQKAFKPNMDVQPDVKLYRVDPVIIGDYVPPNAENEITMECFDLRHWQAVVHQDDSGCQQPIDLEGLQKNLRDERAWFKDCWVACDSEYCQEKCIELHFQRVQDILDEYRP